MPCKLTKTPDAVDIHVGARVYAERNRRGLSQSELGTAIGVTFQQVQKYERAANHISASMLARIAKALDTAIADFFPPDDPSAAARVKIGAIKGGHELAECYAAMTPERQAVFLSLARELSR